MVLTLISRLTYLTASFQISQITIQLIFRKKDYLILSILIRLSGLKSYRLTDERASKVSFSFILEARQKVVIFLLISKVIIRFLRFLKSRLFVSINSKFIRFANIVRIATLIRRSLIYKRPTQVLTSTIIKKTGVFQLIPESAAFRARIKITRLVR